MTREEAISRQDVLDAISRIGLFKSDTREVQAVAECLRAVEALPSVKLQEPKTGHWVAQDIHNCHTDFKCSECDYIHSFMHLYGKPTADYTYCPNCGAKMKSEVEE